MRCRIGRITEGLLLSIAETVDVVEPIAKFSDMLKGKPGIGKIFVTGLEDWSPESVDDGKYGMYIVHPDLEHLQEDELPR